MNGVLTDVIDYSPPDTDDALRHDLVCVLVECHRDRGSPGLSSALEPAKLNALAGEMARRLAPRIGGRYVPKRDARAIRDAAVVAAFTGRNHQEVMARFRISRRLMYSILARARAVS